MAAKSEVIVIRERFLHSVGKDVVSFATLIATIGVGVWLDSSALQWIAGLAWIAWCFARVTRLVKDNTFSIAQARKRLDEIEAEMNS